MTRLLHAVARGARVQIKCDEWETDKFVMVMDLQDPRYDYRIHPDDEHLQYGPISSALRYEAEAPDRYYYRSMSDELQYGFDFGLADCGIYWYDIKADDLTRSLFLLILAEALADEGM